MSEIFWNWTKSNRQHKTIKARLSDLQYFDKCCLYFNISPLKKGMYVCILISLLWKRYVPSFEQIQISFNTEYFVPSLVEIGLVILEKRIFKYRQYIYFVTLVGREVLRIEQWQKVPFCCKNMFFFFFFFIL